MEMETIGLDSMIKKRKENLFGLMVNQSLLLNGQEGNQIQVVIVSIYGKIMLVIGMILDVGVS